MERNKNNDAVLTKEGEKLEDEKRIILSQVPSDVTKCFRQIRFAKRREAYVPVIELSPYDVEPGFIREQWMRMFKRVRNDDDCQLHIYFLLRLL